MSMKDKIKEMLPSGMTSTIVVNGFKKAVAVPDFPFSWKTSNRQMLDKCVVSVSYRKGDPASVPVLIYGDTLFPVVSLLEVKESRVLSENNGVEHHSESVIALMMMPKGFRHTDNLEALIDAAECIYFPDMWESQSFSLSDEQTNVLNKLSDVCKKALSGSTHYQKQMDVWFKQSDSIPKLILHSGGLLFTNEDGADQTVIDTYNYIELLDSLKSFDKGSNTVFTEMAASFLIVKLQQGLSKLNINLEDGVSVISDAQKQELKEKIEQLKQRHAASGQQLSAAIMQLHGVDDDIPEQVKREIARRNSSNHSIADDGKTSAWLESVLGIPFGQYATPSLSLESVLNGMNTTHYGMEKAKEKVLSFVARAIRQKETGELGNEPTILCFVGAPGIGKTTLAKSLANSLNLPSEIISLAGASDPHILRGHSFTYVGSEMGKIGRALTNMGVMNGVLILDEIDKTNKNGARASGIDDALLALLDPSQNNNFHDDYLGFGLDVSKCLIICTANYIDQIPEALESRMSIIKLHSYSMPQKTHIGKQYLLPDVMKAIKGKDGFSVSISDDAWEILSSQYTFEAGVRKLRECVVDIANKAVVSFLQDNTQPEFAVTSKNIMEYLGKPKIVPCKVPDAPLRKGVINGLSVMGYVGGILPFNAALRPNFKTSKEASIGKLILTGMQKEMMKESFDDAFSVALNLFAEDPNKDQKLDRLYNHDIHLSTDETATPKDGNSAGGVVTVLLYALLADKEIRSDVAMTGAINLQGQIKAIGGLREKLLGAAEAGVKLALYPTENQADFEDIDPSDLEYIERTGMKVKAISSIDEAIKEFIQ